jgi:hypothetical protein
VAAERAMNATSRVAIREASNNNQLLGAVLPVVVEKGLHSALKTNRAIG